MAGTVAIAVFTFAYVGKQLYELIETEMCIRDRYYLSPKEVYAYCDTFRSFLSPKDRRELFVCINVARGL